MLRLAAFLVAFATSCDPVYSYCATVTRCRDGAPVEDLRVRFDHEGVYDTRTSAEGKTCSGEVGLPPRPHLIEIDLAKEGYVPLIVSARSRKVEAALDVAVCVCEEDGPSCQGMLVDATQDAGAGADASTGGNP